MSREGRSVLLFMDNAGCHPSDIKSKFSNINVCFLPANTTSRLQPLDLSIIMNFKTYYQKLLMQNVLATIEECSSATEVTKSVTILLAIRKPLLTYKLLYTLIQKLSKRRATFEKSNFENKEKWRKVLIQELMSSDESGMDEDGRAVIFVKDIPWRNDKVGRFFKRLDMVQQQSLASYPVAKCLFPSRNCKLLLPVCVKRK